MTKLVFFGNERLATGVTTDLPVLRALVNAGYEIAAIVIAQSDATPSRQDQTIEIIDFATEHGIEILTPAKPADIIDQLQGYQASAAILVAYGQLLPQAVIDSFPNGIINLHPSLLPRHRGPTPIEHAILAGDAETAVSLMQLTSTMDAGPVYAQEVLALEGNEVKQQLADQLGLIGAQMLVEHLPAILSDQLQPTAQDDQSATYDKRLEKVDGQLDFNKSATQLVREVRAYAGWPRSRAQIANVDVIVTQAHIGIKTGAAGSICLDDKELGIYTADTVLLIDSLIPAGKKEMTAAAFLAGYRP